MNGTPKPRPIWPLAVVSAALGVVALALILRPAPKPPSGGTTAPPTEAPPGMVWIPGGEFVMGSDGPEANADEGPAHPVRVDGFWMDATEVTNAQFAEFVEATGYVTIAERALDWEELQKQLPPGALKPPEEALAPGSLVFVAPRAPVPLEDLSKWWIWTPGANWRNPEGSGSSIEDRTNHPVVHVAWEDAVAYAEWGGKRLPTEAEWEFAARGALEGKPFSWGDEFRPDGAYMANTFQGRFPNGDTSADGFAAPAPVGSFPPNGYGLHDTIGNVWEWCADWYRPDAHRAHRRGEVALNPRGPAAGHDPAQPFQPVRATKGGSFLCSEMYCSNYRPSARIGTAADSGMSHLGFRCVKSR
jgi:formylglycine-generating enzyme required for sulfatase activity